MLSKEEWLRWKAWKEEQEEKDYAEAWKKVQIRLKELKKRRKNTKDEFNNR